MPHHYQRTFFLKKQQILFGDKVEVVDVCRALGSVIGSDNEEKTCRKITKTA